MSQALELFSGTDSVGKVLRDLGWTVASVDNGSEWAKGDPWGQPTHRMDVREFFRLYPAARKEVRRRTRAQRAFQARRLGKMMEAFGLEGGEGQ